MFDFTRLTEHFGDLIGSASSSAFSVEGIVSAAGIDLDQLQGLTVEEVLSALSAAGVNVSALTEGQLGELMDAVQGDQAALS